MKITVVPANRLTDADLARWSEMQQADPSLWSPCFRPEFVEAVAALRSDVEVGVLEEPGQVCGFFPFQRGRWKIGRPVGEPLSDFHGVIARAGVAWSAEELVRGCGLNAWRFDHLPADQPPFCSHCRAETPSPWVDLSRGFDAYRQQRERAGSGEVARIERIRRVAERQVGPVRFEFHSTDDRVFDTLLRWKSQQYRRTRYVDVLAFPWVVGLLDRIRRRQGEAFSGLLSALYLGDRLAAVHLGMRSYGVLHYWFPAYDPELGRHSPGLICFLEIAKAAASLGVQRIDLGKGLEPYKTRLMSDASVVAEGSVTCQPVLRAIERAAQGGRRLARLPLLGAPARLAAMVTRPVRRWMTFRGHVRCVERHP